jgi:broad specificity phosphatase PhoE
MRVILVRHGDAVNSNGKFHGLVDNPLTDEGRKEADEIADTVKQFNPSMIYTSPLSRARETAKIIGSKINVPVQSNKALLPLDLGSFVGKPIEQNLDKVRHYLDNPNERIPNGGTVNQWARQYLPFFEQLHKNKSDQNVVFVTHGRNIILTKAYLKVKGRAPAFDKSVLLNNDKSTEHGGYAVAEPNGNFSIETPKKVMAGQS